MRRILLFLGLGFLIIACKGKKNSKDIVEGRITGLKKGTVYLNKIERGKLIPVDSVQVKGTDKFSFDLTAYEPQLMAITLKENENKSYILFFADDTVNTVKTSLRKFGIDKVVEGGENHRKWIEYREMIRQYNDRKLDWVKENFEAAKNKDTAELNKTTEALKSLEKRRVLYALNYSFTHKDLPVGAYVALKELALNPKLLDTVYRAMNDRMKRSYYGKQIKSVLDSLND
jgi:hypothetical protein